MIDDMCDVEKLIVIFFLKRVQVTWRKYIVQVGFDVTFNYEYTLNGC